MKSTIKSLTIALAGMLMLWSCSSSSDDPDGPKPVDPPVVGPTTSHMVTEENHVVKTNDITIDLPLSAIGDSAEVTITKTESTTPLIECDERNVIYDISLGNEHDINGAIEIKIPFKRSKADNLLAAGYYNEETQEWDPVDWKYKDGNVIITTAHLSKYGIFEIKYENTASANFIATCETYEYLFGNPDDPDEKHPVQAFVSLSQTDGKAARILDVLTDVYSKENTFVNDLGYNSIKALGFDTCVDGFMDSYGQVFSYLGVLYTTWQVARQVHEGKNTDAFASIIDATTTNAISILGGIFGAAYGVVGLAAYMASKYVINSFFEGIITERKDVWVEAYQLYQREHPRYYKDWYKLIYPIITNSNLENWDKEAAIDKLVTDYCYEFWKDYDVVLEYYYNVTKNTSGAGMNEDNPVYQQMKEEISENRRGQLYNNTIPEVMNEINEKLADKNYMQYSDQLGKYKRMMNQKFTLSFVDDDLKDGKSALKGYKVKFADLPKNIVDPKHWECTLDESGKGTIKITVFAYVKNKMQPKMVLVDKNDKVVREFTFTPNPPENTIHIKAEAPNDLIGEWTYSLFKNDPEYSFFKGNCNASAGTLKFNEDGTYEEAYYEGYLDESSRKFSYTSWGCEVESHGTYTIEDNKLTLHHAERTFSWLIYEYDTFIISMEDVNGATSNYVDFPSFNGKKLQLTMITPESNRDTRPLFKDLLQTEETHATFPEKFTGMRVVFECPLHNNRKGSGGESSEVDDFFRDDTNFEDGEFKVTQNGEKYHFVGGRTYVDEYNTDIKTVREISFDLEKIINPDGKDDYIVSNFTYHYKAHNDNSQYSSDYDFKCNAVKFPTDPEFISWDRTLVLTATKDNSSVTCDYSLDCNAKDEDADSYKDTGKLNSQEEYNIQLWIDAR